MAWENRNGREYYYRKRRKNGRVVSEYIGSGAIAELTAILDQEAQAEREAEREAHRQERAAVEAIDSDLDQLDELSKALTRAALLLAGCYPHKRQWRWRRNG